MNPLTLVNGRQWRASCGAHSKTSALVVTQVLSVVALCAVAVVAARDERVVAQAEPCLVTTANGNIVGVRRGGVCAYLGVPYAAPPVGDLRWKPPQPRAPWAPATLNATAAPPVCAQVNVATGALAGNEDCLTLNIWTPAVKSSARGTDVFLWLHTGGFQETSSNFTDGQRFADERGVVVVAPNYRLGPFGFLTHSALTVEDAGYNSSGNYGLADQRAAMRWVRHNIAAFGGDPDNVTLAGQSAGATSVQFHLMSPASRGLFHRAIVQSGYGSVRWKTADEALAQGDALAASLGCTDRAGMVGCLRSATRDQVLRALPAARLQIIEPQALVQWAPVVDGLEIPDQPRDMLRRGEFSRMPVILGVTGDEGWTFVDRSFPSGLDALQYDRAVRTEFGMDAEAVLRLYPANAFPTPKDALARLTGDVEFACETRRVARALHHEGAPVYFYSFEHTVDVLTAGRASHSLELNFLFGNNFGAPSPYVLTEPDLALFRSMSTYWRQFAETGTPNHPDNPIQWPAFRPQPSYGSEPVDPSRSDRYLVLERRIGEASYLRDAQCNFWESFYFRSVLGTVPAAARW